MHTARPVAPLYRLSPNAYWRGLIPGSTDLESGRVGGEVEAVGIGLAGSARKLCMLLFLCKRGPAMPRMKLYRGVN